MLFVSKKTTPISDQYNSKVVNKHKVISMKPYMINYCKNNNLYSDYDRLYCLNAFSDHKITETTYSNGTYLQNHDEHYNKHKLKHEIINGKLNDMINLYQFNHLL